MDADTDEATEYESDASVDAEVPEERKGVSGLGGLHGDGYCRQPPTVLDAQLALEDLMSVLYPPRQRLQGCTSLDPSTFAQLDDIWNFLWQYCEFNANGKPKNPSAGNWMKASIDVAAYKSKGSWQAQTLRALARAYVQTQESPTHNYQDQKQSHLDDGALSTELQLHLQHVGKYICAQDIVNFTKNSDVQKRYGFTKPVFFTMAKHWMGLLGFRWTKEPKGQYHDGHECTDMVEYRQGVFLPAWTKLEESMCDWTGDSIHLKVDEDHNSRPDIWNVVVWFHDKSMFYAHDRCTVYWRHKDDGPKPQPKGEGALLMVAHFVSADYGYLQSPDGAETACILFRAGKGHNGYYTNERIIQHAKKAIDILQKYYPNDDHVMVFDNAMTYVK